MVGVVVAMVVMRSIVALFFPTFSWLSLVLVRVFFVCVRFIASVLYPFFSYRLFFVDFSEWIMGCLFLLAHFLLLMRFGCFACCPPEGRVWVQVPLRESPRNYRRLSGGRHGDDRRLDPRIGIQQVRSFGVLLGTSFGTSFGISFRYWFGMSHGT